MQVNDLIKLCDEYSNATGRSHWQVGLAAVGSAKFFRDLRTGTRTSCTLRSYDRAVDWFAKNWPKDVTWPDNIRRPEQIEGT